MTGKELREAALDSFRENVLNRRFTRHELNPHRLPQLSAHPLFRNFTIEPTSLVISQRSGSASILLEFSSGGREWRVQGPSLQPLIHWIVAEMPPYQFENILQASGGILHDSEVLANLEGWIVRGGVRTGVQLAELPGGGREFISFGYDLAVNFGVVLGLDVPCDETDDYVHPQPESKYYSEWKVLKVIAEDGTFCRIPAVIFYPPYVSGRRI